MRALTLQVIEGRYDGMHQFEFGLDPLLDGLERLRHKTPREGLRAAATRVKAPAKR